MTPDPTPTFDARDVPSTITPSEPSEYDRGVIRQLWLDHGDTGAERQICRTITALEGALAGADRAIADGRLAEVSTYARQISRLGASIGFRSVARIAPMVEETAIRRDPAAVASTLARLTRHCDRSIYEIWDISGT
ncbi:hypothetical protein [Pelagovum pacificum]|nr:hypothetical protein [Pelagovum pacificum]